MNTPTAAHAVSRWVILMLAIGAGFSVASIYYAQPLLPLMGADLHLSIEGMGLVPTLTQAGYALGILFLLPLIVALPHFFGIMGVLYAGPIADAAAFVLAVVFARRELGKMKKA